MGRFANITEFLVKSVISSLILWVVLIVVVQVEVSKIPILLLYVMVANLLAGFITWIILGGTKLGL